MTYLILDLVIAALLAMAAWRGYRRGFVLTLCGFLAIFVAYVGAMEVGDQVKLRIWRDGQEQELYVTVGDLNQIGTKILNDEYADLLD